MAKKISGNLPSKEDTAPPISEMPSSHRNPSNKIDLFGVAVLNSVSAHIAVLDRDGRIIAINDAWKTFATQNEGTTGAIDVGANYFDACDSAVRSVGAADAVKAIDGIKKVMDGIVNEFEMEYACHSPDEKRWFLMRATPMQYAGNKVVVSHINITDKILVENELFALHEVSRAASASISLEGVTNATLSQISAIIHPDMAMVFLRDGDKLLLQGSSPKQEAGGPEMHHTHRVGQCLCGLSVSNQKSIFSSDIKNDERCTWQECKKAGFTSFAAIPLISRSDVIGTLGIASIRKRNFERHRRFLESMAKDIAICFDNSILYEKVKVYADDLETELAERKKMEEMLRQTQKMEAIGKLAGGIAHDFNNILSPILGYTELTLNDLEDGSPFRNDLMEVFNAGHRAKSLVQQILTFTRQSESEQRPINVSTPVREALQLLRSTLPSTIDIVSHINEDLAPIIGDTTQIYQIVMNLCTNAAQAMEDRSGILEVSLEQVYWDSKFIVSYKILPKGHYIKLSVSDTGIGIEPDILESIFDPYFTTKEINKGTGLGLAVVQGIVKNHNGEINVYSEPNNGSTFTIYLPTTADEIEKKIEETTEIPGGTESILYVDDEISVANLGKRLLEQLGYRVTAVTRSLDALERYKNDPSQFDAVVTDMTMPKLRGDQLAKQIHAIRPGLPIVVCSGFSRHISMEIANGLRGVGLLVKPFTQRELANAVRSAIDNRPAATG